MSEENHAPNNKKSEMSSPTKISDYFAAAPKPSVAKKSLPTNSAASSIIEKLKPVDKPPVASSKPQTAPTSKSSSASTAAKPSSVKEEGKDAKSDATSDKVTFLAPSLSVPVQPP